MDTFYTSGAQGDHVEKGPEVTWRQKCEREDERKKLINQRKTAL